MIPQWLHGKRIAVFDLETDRIPTTVIYMIGISIIDIDINGAYTIEKSTVYTYQWNTYAAGPLYEGVAKILSCDFVAGHNSVGFDTPEILKHLSVAIKLPHLDTMILAKLVFTKDDLIAIDASLRLDKALWGSYSLKAFGQRMGDAKIEFHEFDEMTKEMAIYCSQDVDLTAQLLLFLLEKPELPIYSVIELEHKAARIIAEQTEHGFYFDIEKAKALNTRLLAEKAQIARELETVFKPKWLRDGQPKIYKKETTTRIFLPNNKYIPLLGTSNSI